MPSFTTNQKIALAVSVPVAGILLYVLLKWAREADEFVDDIDITADGADEFSASADLVSEFQIQQSHVGAVIGRGGSVIKKIQKDSQTRINFKDDDSESGDEASEEAELPKQRERTILIRGSRERIKQAEVLIQKVIDEQPVLQKVKVEIPQRLIGRIIGKGGKTIRQLCRVSGARIKIEHDNEVGEVRTCDIVGTETQIECAKQLIDEKMSEDKAFRAKKNQAQDAKNKLTFAHLPSDGDYFGVYMSAVDTPAHFWLQNVTKNSTQLDDLVEEMTQFYGDRGEGHRLIPPKAGDLCCTTFKHDESWYRGEIVKVLEESSQVRLHYLDFGDTGVVPVSNVKEIRKEFCYLPFQAIECCLANVKPKGEKWSREACDAFEKLSFCAQWKVLMARVVYYDENGMPYVQLFDTTGEQDVNIEETLVEKGLAEEKKDASKTSNSSFESSKVAVEEIIAEQKASTLEEMNERFPSPGFENVSFDMDRSESFEFPSPIDSSSRLNDKEIANEPTITPVEHQVVSCADISQLGALFGKLNVDSNLSVKDDEGLGNSKTSENLSGEPYLDEKDSKNTPVETKEGNVCVMNNVSNKPEGAVSENFIEEVLEHGLEAAGSNSENDRINFSELQENSGKDHIGADQDSRNSEEVVFETPITSSVAENAQGSYGQPLTFSDSLFTEHAAVGESSFEVENLPDSAAMDVLKDNDNRKNDELSMIKDVFNMPSENDNPVTSSLEYDPNEASETTVKPMTNDYANRDEQNVGTLENGTDRADYVLRRSCSEDLNADDTLTNGALAKSSSEIAVSPNKDLNTKTQLSSRSLGSLLSFPKGGKRVLAANFGQVPSHAKPESDQDDDEDDDDDDSIYLSAREDSDSTGFLSAVGSRSNLRIDTDSDATPSGYLSEPEDSPVEIDTIAVDAQARLDTTLLVEKLEQYADK